MRDKRSISGKTTNLAHPLGPVQPIADADGAPSGAAYFVDVTEVVG